MARELLEMENTGPGSALERVGTAFEDDYLAARRNIEQELCRLTLEKRDTEYEFNIQLDREPHFRIICRQCEDRTTLLGNIVHKTTVLIHKLELNPAGNLQLSKSYGPYDYDYIYEETTYRYLMYYGNRPGLEFEHFGYIMPTRTIREFDGTFAAANITLTLPETTDEQGNLVADWLRPLRRDLFCLTINSRRSFVINATAHAKLITVDDLTINGATTRMTLDSVEGFQGINFHYNDPEGPMPIPINREFVMYFNSRRFAPGQQTPRTFVFNVTLSENDRRTIIDLLDMTDDERTEAESTGRFSKIERYIEKTIEWSPNHLMMYLGTPPAPRP